MKNKQLNSRQLAARANRAIVHKYLKLGLSVIETSKLSGVGRLTVLGYRRELVNEGVLDGRWEIIAKRREAKAQQAA